MRDEQKNATQPAAAQREPKAAQRETKTAQRRPASGKPIRKRIMEAADRPLRPGTLAGVITLLLVLAFLVGAVVGIGTIGTLRLSELLQRLLWDRLRDALPTALLQRISPVALGVAGGALIGLAAQRFGYSLDTLGQVIAKAKATGTYRLPSIGKSLVLFLLPIAFGGAVGPEAGVCGFVTAGVYAGIHALRRSGLAAVRNPDHALSAAIRSLTGAQGPVSQGAERHPFTYAYSRPASGVLWVVAAAGFVLGIMGFVTCFGTAGSLPRFAPIDYLSASTRDWMWALAALVIGYALAQFSLLCHAVSGTIATAIGEQRHVTRAVIAGAFLGLLAIGLPDVLFSGQTGTVALLGSWQRSTALFLALTCVAKLAATAVCVAGGWIGGEFFPMIFCGVSAGYALSLATGCDPTIAVACTTAALVSACTRKPVLTIVVLALCFPPTTLPLVAVCAALAAKAPGLRR